MPETDRRNWKASWPVGFTLAVAIGLVAYGAMIVVDRRTGTLRAGSTPTTIGLYFGAFASYLILVHANERHRLPAGWLWCVPIGFRLLLLATEPTLSDDVYRYLWDGHVLSNAVNPYSYVVSATELDRLDIPIRALVNNPDLASPYLPTTQLVFAAIAVTLPTGPLAVQVAMVAFDVAAAAVLWRILPLAGLPARRAMVYLWNPLVVIEIAHGAHFDSLMTLLALVSVWAAFRPKTTPAAPSPAVPSPAAPSPTAPPRATLRLARGRRSATSRGSGLDRFIAPTALALASPVALAMAVLTRPVPLLLAPVLWWRWTWSQRIGFAIALVVILVPFGFGVSGWGLGDPAPGTGVFGSARVYGAEFRFNTEVARWIEDAASGFNASANTIIGAVMVFVLGWIWARARPDGDHGTERDRRDLRLLSIPLLGYVVLTPVLHPWYLTIVVAFLAFLTPTTAESRRRWWLTAPWAYLTATISLSYLTYIDPLAFGELDWVRRLEWYPVLGGAAVVMLASRLGGLSQQSGSVSLATRAASPR